PFAFGNSFFAGIRDTPTPYPRTDHPDFCKRLQAGLLFQGLSAPSVSTGALPPVSLKILRTLRPPLNGAPVPSTMSPNLRVFLFQPRRNSADGLVVSAIQFETLPFSSFTSK